MLPLLLLLLLVLSPSTLFAHVCEHDHHQAQTKVTVDPEVSSSTPSRHALQTAMSPIRINFDTTLLNPGADSGTTYCTTGTNCLTPEKTAYLRSTLLPKAADWLSKALSVVPLTSNIVVSAACYQVTLAQMTTTVKTTGVAADMLVFVTARPTSAGVLAWATYCRTASSGRPIVAQINFGPESISVLASALDMQVSVAIHELSHALGFSSSAFATFKTPTGVLRTGVTKSVVVNGVARTALTLPTVIQKMREHYNCQDAAVNYLELEESGGSGTAGSHFEARVVNHEYMAGRASLNPAYSALSLALFEDSGWYKANYAMAKGFLWGKDEGCAFLTGRCSTWTNKQYFCSSSTQTGCSFDGRKAYCALATYTSAISPSSFQYFSTATQGGQDQSMDFCPVLKGYSNGDCTVAANAGSQSSSLFGETYSASAKTTCFTGNVFPTGYVADSGAVKPFCFKYECRGTSAAPQLWVSVARNGVDSWKQCFNGVTVTGFTGILTGRYVVCPAKTTSLCPIGTVVTAITNSTDPQPSLAPEVSLVPLPPTPTATPAPSAALVPGAAPVAGTSAAASYSDFSSQISIVSGSATFTLKRTSGASGNLDLLISYAPDLPEVSGAGNPVWRSAVNDPTKDDVITVDSTDPRYRAGLLTVRVFSELASTWTLAVAVTATAQAPVCPYDCSGLGTCEVSSDPLVAPSCKGCPYRRRGRGCELDDTATLDLAISDAMTSAAGQPVTVKVKPGATALIYLPMLTRANVGVSVIGQAPAGTLLVSSPARDEHPSASSNIWSSTTGVLEIKHDDPSFPNTGLYLGVVLPSDAKDETSVTLTVTLTDVASMASLKQCASPCDSGTVCENGLCVSHSRRLSKGLLAAVVVAPVAAVALVIVAVLTLKNRKSRLGTATRI